MFDGLALVRLALQVEPRCPLSVNTFTQTKTGVVEDLAGSSGAEQAHEGKSSPNGVTAEMLSASPEEQIACLVEIGVSVPGF